MSKTKTKAFENKLTSIATGKDKFLSYADLLKSLVDGPVKEGITISEMKRDLKLFGDIESLKENDKLLLDEETLQHVKKLVSEARWVVRHVDIITFSEYIDSL